jgi:hypothetical protein
MITKVQLGNPRRVEIQANMYEEDQNESSKIWNESTLFVIGRFKHWSRFI